MEEPGVKEEEEEEEEEEDSATMKDIVLCLCGVGELLAAYRP